MNLAVQSAFRILSSEEPSEPSSASHAQLHQSISYNGATSLAPACPVQFKAGEYLAKNFPAYSKGLFI